LQATRRQLARLGVGELSKLMPSPSSGARAKDVAERVGDVASEKPVKPDLGVEITPP
jgi:hypothetical protein